ncbi:MAG: glutamine synthetase family protein [Cyanobacteria bacterium P01_A01_bin.37]
MGNNLSIFLTEQNVQFIRLVWCDNANIIRGKAFHRAFLTEHEETGISLSVAQQAVPVMSDEVAKGSGLGPVGEAWLIPDWSTLTPLPYTPGHARVIGDMFREGQPWSLCPRIFLRRMIAAAEDLDLQVMASFEHEFYLLNPPDDGGKLNPVDQTVFASTYGMDSGAEVINAIASALVAQGIPAECYYAESGPGQHEISIRYTQALQAADWAIAFRETVRGTALRHGLLASFVPKLFADSAGNGCHLHLSLWRDRQNLIPHAHNPNTLSPVAQSFMAGLLHHLPALMAIATPSTNSYRRLRPHLWSGAYRCWGMDNREAAIRVPSNARSPSPTHIELKTVDASANPYLALGAVIAAGLDGIEQSMKLPDPVSVDPGCLSDEQRAEKGIEPLPDTLGMAIAHLTKDTVLLDALGSDLAQAFLAVRNAEWNAMKDFDLQQEVALLINRY